MSKYVTWKQIAEIIKIHFFTVCPIALIGLLIFAGVVTNPVGSVIFSVIATLIYFFSLYDKACDIAKRDKKSYTPEQPYIFKGALLPLGLLVLSVIIYMLYFISWKYMSIDGVIVGVSGWINNFICIIWTFPFTGFMTLKNGYMSLSGHLLVYLLPFAACFLGYLAGYKNYDITASISKFVYTSDKKGEKGENK